MKLKALTEKRAELVEKMNSLVNQADTENRAMSEEEAARASRYEFLENAAEKLGCSVIATAHNANDNAETMLFNLTRGGGLKGLC